MQNIVLVPLNILQKYSLSFQLFELSFSYLCNRKVVFLVQNYLCMSSWYSSRIYSCFILHHSSNLVYFPYRFTSHSIYISNSHINLLNFNFDQLFPQCSSFVTAQSQLYHNREIMNLLQPGFVSSLVLILSLPLPNAASLKMIFVLQRLSYQLKCDY